MRREPELIEIDDEYSIWIWWHSDVPTVSLQRWNPQRENWDSPARLRVPHYEDMRDVYTTAMRLVEQHWPEIYGEAYAILEPKMEGL